MPWDAASAHPGPWGVSGPVPRCGEQLRALGTAKVGGEWAWEASPASGHLCCLGLSGDELLQPLGVKA